MTTRITKPVRCAVYCRVSSDQGLDQDFNSLDAQYEASQAYIKSQAHAGWALIRTRYEDGGYSGGSTERPALQLLLSDVRAGKIDVIVVYKVDRLTRSLADFAKLVELFDAHDVSFVSVTQQFNTTTSMGRLTLNVLLSFAQFEREVTSERIRDKIAASKRRGMWVGGWVPLGYDSKDRTVTINESEADAVRTIFRRYLDLGSLNLLMGDLRDRGIVTKRRAQKNGRAFGGIPFTRGPLAYLLRNRFYLGEIEFKGEIHLGEHPPILDRDLFEAVQTKLSQQLVNHTNSRKESKALLLGLITDDRGNRMGPSHTTKNSRKYRYYVSTPLVQAQRHKAGSVARVPAGEVDALVVSALRSKFPDASELADTNLIHTFVDRVEVQHNRLIVALKDEVLPHTEEIAATAEAPSPATTLQIAWQKPPSKRKREILLPVSSAKGVKPIQADTRATLVSAIAKARRWLDDLVSGRIKDLNEIASGENCSLRKVEMTLSLAFLAPGLVKAAIEGRLPHGLGMVRLYEPPAEWSQQYTKLGLSPS